MLEWRVRADLAADGKMQLDGALAQGSPVDLLVAAVAGCFVKSCHMVQEARGEARTRVLAEVTGVKPAEPPNRVGKITIRWSLPGLAPDHAARIAKDAKRICTVTNSMSCEFEVTAL